MNLTSLDSSLAQVYQIVEEGAKSGVGHLTAQDETYNGREVTINGKKHLNFTSCSYLGLALDPRVIEGAVDGVQRLGTSFPTSRSFVTMGYLEELEQQLEALFGYSCIVASSTSLAHTAFLPIFINHKDVFICDHQVHTSVRVASEIIRAKGCARDVVRHNDIESLEQKIIQYQATHRHVWFLADGIYSMYGDKAPMKELWRLLETHDNFHVYIDDAHGMSWIGERGKGYVLSQVNLHPRMVLSTSLGKAFGSIGGVLVCNNPELKKIIKACGSAFIFSSPIPPSVIGASLAAAKIHLTPELNDLQGQLMQRIQYFKTLAKQAGLPLLGKGDTPIFFIPSGTPDTCFEIMQRMMARGFYQSPAVFPSVPYNNAGIRLTLTNWLKLEDLEQLVTCLKTEREQVFQKANMTNEGLKKHFKGIELNLA